MAMTTRYVSPSGAATYANSTNLATPMSISTAAASVLGGDDLRLLPGTYNLAAALTFATVATVAAPVFVRAADAAGAPLDPTWNADGTLNMTGLPLISCSGGSTRPIFGSNYYVRSLNITGAGSPRHMSGWTDGTMENCRLVNTGNGSTLECAFARFYVRNCDILNTSGASSAVAMVTVSAQTCLDSCRLIPSQTTTIQCIVHSAGLLVVNRCLLKAGLRGISVTAATNGVKLVARDNTLVGAGSNAILFVANSLNTHEIIGNMITDNGGVGINIGAGNAMILRNRFRNNTGGNLTATNALATHSYTYGGNVLTDLGTGAAQDYTTPGSDYTLVSGSPAIGVNIPRPRDIGAFQRSP